MALHFAVTLQRKYYSYQLLALKCDLLVASSSKKELDTGNTLLVTSCCPRLAMGCL